MRARNFSWSPRHLTLGGDQEGVGETPCHSPSPRIAPLVRWCAPGALPSTFAAETSLALYHNWQVCWRVHANLSSTDFTARPWVQLYLYVHRVDGLAPGVYRSWPEIEGLEA